MIPDDLKVGDEVIIKLSPYSDVKPGEIATVHRILPNHYSPGIHVYWLSGVSHKMFFRWELTRKDETL